MTQLYYKPFTCAGNPTQELRPSEVTLCTIRKIAHTYNALRSKNNNKVYFN